MKYIFMISLAFLGCSIIRINSKYDDFDFYGEEYLKKYVTNFDINMFNYKYSTKEAKFQEIQAADIQPLFGRKPLTWIYSWGPHCPPCVAKLPTYDSLSVINANNLQLIPISYEYDVYFMKEIYKKYKLSNRSYLLRNEKKGKLKISDKIYNFENILCPGIFEYGHGFPTHYIFNTAGKLVWHKIGAVPGAEIARALDSLSAH